MQSYRSKAAAVFVQIHYEQCFCGEVGFGGTAFLHRIMMSLIESSGAFLSEVQFMCRILVTAGISHAVRIYPMIPLDRSGKHFCTAKPFCTLI